MDRRGHAEGPGDSGVGGAEMVTGPGATAGLFNCGAGRVSSAKQSKQQNDIKMEYFWKLMGSAVSSLKITTLLRKNSRAFSSCLRNVFFFSCKPQTRHTSNTSS